MDEVSTAIRAGDAAGFMQIQIDQWMTKRPFAAIAGGAVAFDVYYLEIRRIFLFCLLSCMLHVSVSIVTRLLGEYHVYIRIQP